MLRDVRETYQHTRFYGSSGITLTIVAWYFNPRNEKTELKMSAGFLFRPFFYPNNSAPDKNLKK
jgi:hypothetical protein